MAAFSSRRLLPSVYFAFSSSLVDSFSFAFSSSLVVLVSSAFFFFSVFISSSVLFQSLRPSGNVVSSSMEPVIRNTINTDTCTCTGHLSISDAMGTTCLVCILLINYMQEKSGTAQNCIDVRLKKSHRRQFGCSFYLA